MAQASQHQRNVRQALRGNERVYFHPYKELIAVWYGGAAIEVFDSRTWEAVKVFNVSAHYKGASVESCESAVEIRMAREGFDRKGQSPDDTRLVEARGCS